MTIVSRLQLNAKMQGAPYWRMPNWTAQPTLAALTVGSPVSLASAGTVTGSPTPIITYLLTVGGVSQTWPYTLQSGDGGQNLTLTVIATNSSGYALSNTLTGYIPVPNAAPGNVTNLTAMGLTSSGASPSWAVPTTGGAPNLYTVNYRVTGAGSWTLAGTTTSLFYTISNLLSSTSYDFQVIASNGFGSATGVTVSGSTLAAFWPQTDLGQNVPAGDTSSSTTRVLNNRFLACRNLYIQSYGSPTALPDANKDANGMPTTAFSFILAEGQLMNDSTANGTWYMEYQSSAQRTITWLFDQSTASITSHTFSNGLGKVQFTYTSGVSKPLGVVFDNGVTSCSIFDPTTSATAISGGAAAVPFFGAQFLRTVNPYAYGRMMDASAVNGDYDNVTPVSWSDRRLPTSYQKNYLVGKMGGWPLEWQINLLTLTGKSGWFNISELATDDYITQFATLVATTMPTGKWAAFELGNERWNVSAGFNTYPKAGIAGLRECLGAQASTSTNRYIGDTQSAVTFASDGSTATVVFALPHGATTGGTVKIIGGAGGAYAGFVPANGTTVTVVDSVTITYPCTQASTGGTVTALTVLSSAGFISLQDSALLSSGYITQAFDLSYYWHLRRAFQMAKLVKDAFTAVGRTLNDCKPLFATQVGTAASTLNQIVSFLALMFSGATFGSRFTAFSVGGYYGAQTTGNLNAGFGLSGLANDASLNTEAAVNTRVNYMTDNAIGCCNYTAAVAWSKAQGVEAWNYEIGIDLAGVSGESAGVRAAKEAYQRDYATYGSAMELQAFNWVRNLQTLGFTKMGWYQCGAGTLAGTGSFNLGQTANEIDYTTDPSGQSPKFRGLLDSLIPPNSKYNVHAFPCTLSGYDVVGNEAVATTNGVWPSLGSTNIPYTFGGYRGVNNSGITYRVWSEITQAVTCTIVGDNTGGSNKTITVQNLGGNSGSFSALHNTSNVTLGTCSITLQPGMNYVFVSCAPSDTANLFIRSIQFS